MWSLPKLLLAVSIACCVAATARAAGDPAIVQVEKFDAALLESMRAGAHSDVAARSARLAPVIKQVFDLRAMTGFAVGPSWAVFSPEQQQDAVDAFTRLTIVSYAHNFHEFGGERFEIDPNVTLRGVDKVVQTQLIPPGKAPVSLIYRMRESGGVLKVIDIYYGAVSQLTIRRSDFAGPVSSGGAAGLIAHLNTLSDDLSK